MKKFTIALMAVLLVAAVASADVVTYWSFNSGTDGADIGAGSLSFDAQGANFTATPSSDINAEPGYDGAANTYAGRMSKVDQSGGESYIRISVDLTDYTDVSVSFAGALFWKNETVPGTMSYQYSTDGGSSFSTAVALTEVLPSATDPESYILVDTPAIAALDNVTDAVIQINFDEGSTGTTSRNAVLFDNLKVTGVPEPATMSLLALGGLGVLIRRRR